jgi:hypothetical protein
VKGWINTRICEDDLAMASKSNQCILSAEDGPESGQPRFYRNVNISKKGGGGALPLRKDPHLQAAKVGKLPPWTVFASKRRFWNDQGQMWVQVSSELFGKGSEGIHGAWAIERNTVNGSRVVEECLGPSKVTHTAQLQLACACLSLRR